MNQKAFFIISTGFSIVRSCLRTDSGPLNEVIRLTAMKMRLKMKNRSRRYDIIKLRPGHRHRYTKYKRCLCIIMVISIKQHLNKM